MKVILICKDTLLSCCPILMAGFGVTRMHIFYFFKITNVKVCQMVDQAKIGLTLVQNYICNNVVTDLR